MNVLYFERNQTLLRKRRTDFLNMLYFLSYYIETITADTDK